MVEAVCTGRATPGQVPALDIQTKDPKSQEAPRAHLGPREAHTPPKENISVPLGKMVQPNKKESTCFSCRKIDYFSVENIGVLLMSSFPTHFYNIIFSCYKTGRWGTIKITGISHTENKCKLSALSFRLTKKQTKKPQQPLNQKSPKSAFPKQKQIYVVKSVFSMRNKTDRKFPTLLADKTE